MTDTLSVLGVTVRTSWRRLIIWGLLFVVLSQVAMMFALIIRFQAMPNYVTFYDWLGNAWWIIKSTPSWGDIWPIIAEEWLIEIGQMNYEYGTGISVWSLNVVPSRLVVMFVLGATIGLSATLLRRETCTPSASRSLTAATGLGAVLVAMTNATMSWVVCCATPSWVVGLAMLGLGVSTSLALETMGPTLMFSGFGLLIAQIFFLAWRKSRRELPQMRDSYA